LLEIIHIGKDKKCENWSCPQNSPIFAYR
jgi:hypothetical protein